MSLPSHHVSMGKVHTGSVFGIQPLSDERRAGLRRELEWLETDLIRRRKKLAFWSKCQALAEADATVDDHLREEARYFHAQAQKLVDSGEKLRAYLIADIQDQPEHLPAYHHIH
ncbi:hypothetical protein GCM10010520_23360 [Rhizobium viscosum]|uniref:Uncharacterized protein n=1 Tax=Rhizobium viscosum TaxID=1673 RepID=A0ABR9IJF2_RHIVS|nr:hypothetical protein [Rhizobium viscosum]MBE1503107.1 hypothetical protein [Rhizobium viscosum]